MESSHDDFIREMNERLAFFQGRATTGKGQAALASFERELSKMRTLVARSRGDAVDAGAPIRPTHSSPVGAALLASDD